MKVRDLKDHYEGASVVKTTQCPRCAEEGKDRSGDNAAHYEDGGIYCFSIETRILTDKGVLPISDLLTLPTKVINGDGEWEETQFKYYADQPIMLLTLSLGEVSKVIETTVNHRWFIEGEPDQFFTTEMLQSGDKLISPLADKGLWEVVSTELTDRVEPVYCCETSTQSFTLEDYILTGNCWARHGIIKLSDTYKAKHLLETKQEDINEGNSFEPEYWENLIEATTSKPRGYRNLTEKTCDKYGVRHSVSETTGEVIRQYYPITKDANLVGVRWRDDKKKFYRRGEVGSTCDLFGQSGFLHTPSKRIIIASGEIDTLTLYQVVSGQSEAKGFGEIPVVCTTVGEGGYKQIQRQFEWLNTFERIVICPDQDDAGLKHLHALVKYLPREKIYVMNLPRGYKDANDMLKDGKTAALTDCYFKASSYSPSGIVGSDVLFHDLYDFEEKAKLTFPPFLKNVEEEMLMGGLEFPAIFNIVAPSGCGKSTILNEIIYHWIMEEHYKVGILALESTRKEFAKLLASRHMHRKLAMLKQVERQTLLEDSIQQNENLFFTEEGLPRFYFMEELDGDIKRIKELIEHLILSCDCKIVVIDPLQDLFAGLDNKDEEEFLGWLKLIVKRYEIIIVCINHIRKQDGKTDQNKMYNESEIMGSSTIIKSSFLTLLLNRNKYLGRDDPNSNVTQVMISKNRQTGLTGPCNSLYYDNTTHLLYDLNTYKELHPEVFQEETTY